MKPTVGVLGSSGVVGKAACKYLARFFKVRGGQRKEPTEDIKALDDFKYIKTDIIEEESLNQFCKGCDVVLNCAGPSYKIKEKVAVAAYKAGAIYVDASDILLTEQEVRIKVMPEGRYVVATGYVPGLSGILPKLVEGKYLDQIEEVYCFQGGRQPYSSAALEDIILNSLSDSGYKGIYYSQGKLLQEDMESEEKIQLPGFLEPVYIKSYLSKEMIDVAERLGIKEMHWFNALPDLEIALEQVNYTENCMNQYREHMEKWSALLYEFYGEKQQEKKRYRCIVNLQDSNIVCGEVAALVVKSILNKKPKQGIHWAKDILEVSEVIQYMKKSEALQFAMIEIPYDSGDLLETESGVL